VNNGALGAVEYVEDPANIAATSEEEVSFTSLANQRF
jgi:hypothetical protein